MGAIPANLRLALPKSWPNRIRSAVIHVISLAHFSVTFARSVAANSINARIRLKTDNSRLCGGSPILRFVPVHRQLALDEGLAVASGSLSTGGFHACRSSG